jgi:hypothetical protein
MAEIEFSVLSRQCLDRRIAAAKHLRREVNAWTKSRNQETATVHWHFTVAEARIKLQHLYPVVETVAKAQPPLNSAAAKSSQTSSSAKRKRTAARKKSHSRPSAKRRTPALRPPEL